MLCIVCVKKKKSSSLQPISDSVQNLIETHYKAGFDFKNDDRLPTQICTLCRGYLRDISSGKRTKEIPVFNYRLLDYPLDKRNGM